MSTPLTSKPGTFKATCRLKRPVPYKTLPDDVRVLVDADVTTPGRLKSRWDRKLAVEVVDLPCDFATEDPQAFEAHMADVHGRKSTRRGVWSSKSSELPYLTTPRWKAPKLTEDGTAWDDKEKYRTRTCRGCGLVVELGRDSTAVIEEHKASCADRDNVAAAS